MAMCAARGRARVCQTLSNSRLFALAPQVYLLKNQSKPYTKSSFNFKLIFVATSKDRLTSTWFQERTMTPDAALQLFEDFDKNHSKAGSGRVALASRRPLRHHRSNRERSGAISTGQK